MEKPENMEFAKKLFERLGANVELSFGGIHGNVYVWPATGDSAETGDCTGFILRKDLVDGTIAGGMSTPAWTACVYDGDHGLHPSQDWRTFAMAAVEFADIMGWEGDGGALNAARLIWEEK